MGRAPVGRDACLARLASALSEGTQGLSITAVEGAAGMGKTTLVERALREVGGRPVRRAEGRILQRRVPFGVLDGVLDCSVFDAFDAGSDDPVTWALRGADLLVDELTAVTTTSPAVVVIDDLQWVDPASLIALDRALPRLVHEPVSVLLALRPEARADRETSAILDALADRDATTITLDPLTDEEARAMVLEHAPGLPDGELEAVVRHGAGNPLFLRHLAQADRGEASLGPIVAAHLAQLPDEVASLLRAAAVGGTGIDSGLLEEVIGEDAVAALRVAAASGLVQSDGKGWRFEHDLVRDAVLETTPRGDADRIRRLFVAALSRRGDPQSLSEAAIHAMTAGPPFTDAELNLILRAGQHAVPVDPRLAEELCEFLIDVIPVTDPRHVAAQACLRDAQHWTVVRPLDADAETAVRRVRELAADNAATPHDINDAEHTIRRDLSGAALDESLSVLVSIAPSSRLIDELTDREACLSESARIRVASARVWLEFGAGGASVHACELARELLALTKDRPTSDAYRIDAMLTAGRMLVCLGETSEEGFELLATAARAAEGAGLPREQLLVLFYSGAAHYLWGNWDQAQGLYSAAMSMADDAGRSLTAEARLSLFVIAVQQGDRAAVERLALGPGDWDPRVRREIGRERQLAGDHEEAKRILGQVARDREAAPFVRADALFYYAVSAHLTGDDRGRALVRSIAPTIAGDALQVRAVRALTLALVNLSPDPGLADAMQIRRAMSSAGAPMIPRADGAEAMGLIYQALGAEDAAIEQLTFARDVWSKAGADVRLARVEGWLRELGVRTRGRIDPERPRTGWGAVTDAETKIAALVAEGLIYQDIADRLFLSRRTVESHVSSILRKLGLRNRGELAASYLRRQSG